MAGGEVTEKRGNPIPRLHKGLPQALPHLLIQRPEQRTVKERRQGDLQPVT